MSTHLRDVNVRSVDIAHLNMLVFVSNRVILAYFRCTEDPNGFIVHLKEYVDGIDGYSDYH